MTNNVELAAQLAGYDLADLAAGAGALQLLPDNADHLLRVERLIQIIKSLPANSSAASFMSSSRWRSLVNSPPVADEITVRSEDPFEDLYVYPLAFYGGSYLCMPGLGSQSVAHAQRLIDAIFQARPRPPERLARQCLAMVTAVLVLSDRIAQTAQLMRYQPPGDSRGAAVIPPGPEFRLLKDAVRFTWDEIRELVGAEGADLLGALSAAPGDGELPPDIGDSWGDTTVRPIIDFGDELVVVVPSGLMSALRHWIVLQFDEAGMRPDLGLRYRAMVAREARRALASVGAGDSQPLPPSDPLIENYGVGIDTDIALHLAIVSDDLSGYQADDPFGRWAVGDLTGRVEADLARARALLRQDADDRLSVLHIIVNEGVGRFSTFGLTENATDEDSRVIVTNVDDLTTICEAGSGDALALWKFAVAADELRESTRVMQWSLIDEYELYRSHEDSFYLGDDARPHFVSIEPAYGLELRTKHAQAKDQHLARHPISGADVALLRRYSDGKTPVYATDPLNPPVDFAVEINGMPVAWILPDRENSLEDGMLAFELTELLAYWTWQISTAAPSLTPNCADPVSIILQVDAGDDWVSAPRPIADDSWLSVEPDVGGGLRVRLGTRTAHALAGPTNEGERVIVRELVRCLSRLQGVGVDLDTLLERVAPLGIKKKMAFLDSRKRFSLTPGADLSPARALRQADTAFRLDEAGHWLAQRFPPGDVQEADRVPLLNELVAYHFKDLSARLEDLDGRSLMARLMSQHEALLRDNALHDLDLPTREACFGPDENMMAELAERSQVGVASAIASRFLIEFVASQPPAGRRPTSRRVYDHLLSIASEIVNKGQLSDGIHFQIADTQLSLLESGRLGIDRDGRFHRALDAFRDVRFAIDIELATDNYGRHWDPDIRDSTVTPAIQDFNEAFTAEFGISAGDWGEFIGQALQLGLDLASEPARLPLEIFLRSMADALDWPSAKVEHTLRMAALGERDEFLDEARLSDILPWKFGRDLSYMRRPFILLSRPDEVLWGIRHTERSGGYLVGDLCLQGRLQAHSAAMKSYIGRRRSSEPERFNDLVADVYEAIPQLTVARRVDRFGGTRIAREDGSDLGDVDVLVVDPRARRLIAVECKDFLTARTPSELQRELKKLVSGRKPTVALHGERIRWLKGNMAQVLEAVAPGTRPRGWKVEALIVVSNASMSPLLVDSPIPITTLRDLRAALSHRWRSVPAP